MVVEETTKYKGGAGKRVGGKSLGNRMIFFLMKKLSLPENRLVSIRLRRPRLEGGLLASSHIQVTRERPTILIVRECRLAFY